LRPMGAFDDDTEGDVTRSFKPRLAIGVAGAYNWATNRQRSTIGPTLQLGTFDYVHAAADLMFKWAGVFLFVEVLYRQGLQPAYDGLVGGVPTTEWSRSACGYVVQLGVMVHSRVELASRWNQLILFTGTDPALENLVRTQGHEVGGGINIYLNGHLFKFQADWHYQFGDQADQGRHIVRVQLDATL
jgi:hypothetical protein